MYNTDPSFALSSSGMHGPRHGGEAAQLRLGSEPIVWSGGHAPGCDLVYI